MGEHRLQVLGGDAVVLALVALLVPGLGRKVHRCDGPRDRGTAALRRRKGLMGHTEETVTSRAGRDAVPFSDQKRLVAVPRPTAFM